MKESTRDREEEEDDGKEEGWSFPSPSEWVAAKMRCLEKFPKTKIIHHGCNMSEIKAK